MSSFSFLMNLHTDFLNGCISSPSQLDRRDPLCRKPLQHLLLFDVFMDVDLSVVRWKLNIVVICISLMDSDVEHFFKYLLAICTSVKCFFI